METLKNCYKSLLDNPPFLKLFISTYVLNALSITSYVPTLSTFYQDLEERIEDCFGIPSSVTSNLHHLFNGAFFEDDTNSPFRCTQPKNDNEPVKIRLEGNVSEYKEQLTNYITSQYTELLIEELKLLMNQEDKFKTRSTSK